MLSSVNEVLEEINRRIAELLTQETEFKKKNNISGRLQCKTRREELQGLKNKILGNNPQQNGTI